MDCLSTMPDSCKGNSISSKSGFFSVAISTSTFHEGNADCSTGVLKSSFDGCLEQEQVFVHRDYHSRNLMVLSRRNPGILDFQDAVQRA